MNPQPVSCEAHDALVAAEVPDVQATLGAGCVRRSRSGADVGPAAKPGQSRPEASGRVNPLEPLMPQLMARLRELRRETQEGSARVRTEASGRGPVRGPARAVGGTIR